MKNTFKKSIQFGLFVALFGLSVCLISSCSKDKDSSSPKAHKVVFKAIASDGSSISDAVYGIDADITTATSLSGTTWTSEEVTAAAGTSGATLSVQAQGKDENSSLTLQIYVDGELKKEAKATGKILVSEAMYRF